MTKKIIQVNNIELNLVDMRSKKYRKFLVLAVIHETYENNENFNACTRIRKTAFFSVVTTLRKMNLTTYY